MRQSQFKNAHTPNRACLLFHAAVGATSARLSHELLNAGQAEQKVGHALITFHKTASLTKVKVYIRQLH